MKKYTGQCYFLCVIFRPASMVAIAQLVEPWIVIPVVVGSNPISHPILYRIDEATLTASSAAW